MIAQNDGSVSKGTQEYTVLYYIRRVFVKSNLMEINKKKDIDGKWHIDEE